MTLHQLIRDGDLTGMREALDAGAVPDAIDENEEIPLEVALECQAHEALRLLIEHGASCTTHRPFHICPLYQAIDLDDCQAIRIMKTCGIDLNTAEEDGTSALEIAISWSKIPALRCLLEEGADPNQAAQNGRYPIQHALKPHTAPECLELLLGAGAEVQVLDPRGQSLLFPAAAHQIPTVVRRLAALGLDPNAVDLTGNTPMYYAHMDTCETLLALGAQPHVHIPRAESANPELLADEYLALEDHNATSDGTALRRLIDALAQLDDDQILVIYRRWLHSGNLPKQLLSPTTYRHLQRQAAVSQLVLHAGIACPCPSTNRAFIEPVVEQQGVHFAVREYLQVFGSADAELASGVPNAYYWTRSERRWSFIGHPCGTDEEMRLRAQLAEMVMERFLSGAQGAMAHGCIAMISGLHEQNLKINLDQLQTCQQKALDDPDPYIKNRGEIMAHIGSGDPPPLLPMPGPMPIPEEDPYPKR